VIESSNKNSYVVVLLARKFRYFLKINKGFNNSKVDYTKGKFRGDTQGKREAHEGCVKKASRS
jgi:hypothetical protein